MSGGKQSTSGIIGMSEFTVRVKKTLEKQNGKTVNSDVFRYR